MGDLSKVSGWLVIVFHFQKGKLPGKFPKEKEQEFVVVVSDA